MRCKKCGVPLEREDRVNPFMDSFCKECIDAEKLKSKEDKD